MGMFSRKLEEADAELQQTRAEPVLPAGPAPLKPPDRPVVDKPRARYGVDEAIQLLRTLPSEPQHRDLVMSVVRTTLASMNVQVKDILEDAARKQATLEDKVSALEGAIRGFEQEIADRRTEVSRLHAELEETRQVKERLAT